MKSEGFISVEWLQEKKNNEIKCRNFPTLQKFIACHVYQVRAYWNYCISMKSHPVFHHQRKIQGVGSH